MRVGEGRGRGSFSVCSFNFVFFIVDFYIRE